MVFSSIVFLLLFLPVVLWLHWLGGVRWRNILLLVASLVFYAWGEMLYTGVMLASIALNYGFGLALARWRQGWVLAGAVAVNLGILLWFKYAGWISGMVGLPDPQVHMPLGISFFTFQAISYVVDVWRGEVKAQGNPVDYAMYKALFPQLIAGPIVRYKDVAEDVALDRRSWADTAAGAERFVWGLGKKVLLANPLGAVADNLFALPADQLSTGQAWLAVTAYTLQIYCDFSGYSDMAIGLGRMLGFRFLENFATPYAARSVQDFWRRWHISLSSWFRDYLYIPLGGSRHGEARTYLNLLIVFGLCGLWHGASWLFVLWGLWHGLFLIVERAFLGRALAALWRPVGHVYALAVVMVGWVLFRSHDLTQASTLLRAMAGSGGPGHPEALALDTLHIAAFVLAPLVSLPVAAVVIAWLRPRLDAATRDTLRFSLSGWKLAAAAAILVYALAQVARSTYNPFIYFRF